jgi:hypothetical protein
MELQRSARRAAPRELRSIKTFNAKKRRRAARTKKGHQQPKMAADMDIMLDTQIRNWVVLPMVLIMVLVGVCRHYVIMLMKSESTSDVEEIGYQQALMRCGRLRMNNRFLQKTSFSSRRHFYTAKEGGFLKNEKVRGGPVNPMMNPNGMVDMMKNNMAYMLPNMAMMAWISYFFSGFVVVRVPFPVTQRFKMMLQRGIDVGTLDVSYVSSLSWYFLVMFGLRGFFSLVLGADSGADEARMMQAQMGMGAGPQMGFDPKKAFAAEIDNLDLVRHTFALDTAEKTLLGKKYPVDAAVNKLRRGPKR